jgi:hypothetical protein
MPKTHITKIEINQDSRYTPITGVSVADIPEGVVRDPINNEILTWRRGNEWVKYTYFNNSKKQLTEEYSTGSWTIFTYDESGKETSREDQLGWVSNIPLKEIKNKTLRDMFSSELYYNGQERIFFRIAQGMRYCPKTDYYDCRGCYGVRKDIIKKMPYTSRILESFDPTELIELYKKEIKK